MLVISPGSVVRSPWSVQISLISLPPCMPASKLRKPRVGASSGVTCGNLLRICAPLYIVAGSEYCRMSKKWKNEKEVCYTVFYRASDVHTSKSLLVILTYISYGKSLSYVFFSITHCRMLLTTLYFEEKHVVWRHHSISSSLKLIVCQHTTIFLVYYLVSF